MDLTLKLKIKDKEIKLSQEEAKQLYCFLDEMFGSKNANIPYPVIVEKWIDRTYPTWSSYPIITCNNDLIEYTI